jgi:hypothetical protein
MNTGIIIAALLAASWLTACTPVPATPADGTGTPALSELSGAGSPTVPAPARPVTAPGATEPADAPTGRPSPLATPPPAFTARSSDEAIRSLAEPAPTSPASGTRPAGEAQALVKRAMDRLAQLPGPRIALSDISPVSVEPTQWRDTSLGCPRPGMVYAQVITPGYKIVLKAQGKEYEFHTDRAEAVVLCFVDGQKPG